MSVSICTVTQLARFECLKILKEHIKAQTYYKHIIEWVIVEGSKTKEDADKNKQNIISIANGLNFNITYIEYEENCSLGFKRNKYNVVARGDYIAVFDDDDFYFKTYIEHGITELKKNPRFEIAGCKGIYVYDYELQKYFITDESPNFTSNNCMIYTQKYAKEHKYDNVNVGEELSFLDGFKTALLQLDPRKTVILNSHGINTYNKREIMVSAVHRFHAFIKEELSFKMPNKYFNIYKEIFKNKIEQVDYDIVFCCGFFGIKWNPIDNDLGGSEQAIKFLSAELQKKGYKVCVYGSTEKIKYKDVQYYPMNMFPYRAKFKNLIIWRENGLLSTLPFDIKADNIIHDAHDNIKLSPYKYIHQQYKNKINNYAFKSKYHLDCFREFVNKDIDDKQYFICPNGIQNGFINDEINNKMRVKNRFVYASCYTRGLLQLLIGVWRFIVEFDPTAELHIYYGMDNAPQEFKDKFNEVLKNSKNVMNHGRVDSSIIKLEKMKSQFQLYINNSELEIDCISIRESLGLGCIPLISNFGVYKERDGVVFDFDINEQNFELKSKNIASEIIKLMSDDNKLKDMQEKLLKSNMITRWCDVAYFWTKFLL